MARSKITKDAVQGCMFLSGMAGFGAGLLSTAVLPWYAAIGAGVCVAFVVFMWFAIFLCFKR